MAGYFSPSIAKSILCNENDLLINFHFSHLVIIRFIPIYRPLTDIITRCKRKTAKAVKPLRL